MIIECKNISDFCGLISISVAHDIKDKCVFVSSTTSYPSVSFENSKKDYIKFTYVFFTPLYTVIYSGNIKNNIVDDELETLKDICSKYDIYIHTFDKLNYHSETNTLSVETPLEVI